ncbi:MAG TPA: arylsulfatase, partial [Bryobacteraceae bacterium]|nr:arylsulfatase [Bryobacteraceae bacterium]
DRRGFLKTGVAALAAGLGNGAARRLPNIVFIYADDVGYGDLGCYGATGVRTPNLDRLAQAGVRFTNVHASSATCTPSRYSLLTGEYAWRKKGTGVLPGNAPLIVEPGRTTLPSLLRRAGYRTGAVGKWHLGLGSGNLDWNGDLRPGPFEIGFDYSFIIPATGDRVPCVFVENQRVVNLDPKDPIRVSYNAPIPGAPTGKDHPELLKMLPSHGHDQSIVNGVSRIGYMTGGKSALWVDEKIADTITGKAKGFIEREKAKPFFLYFATHDIHVPRLPDARFVGKSSMGPRGDAIAELDWSVGELLACLDRNKLVQDTLVIFSSDNGPVVDDGYRDQAVEKLGSHRPAGKLRGGKYSIFDGGTRVPMLARWPGQIKAESVSSALISQVDMLSSLAALAEQKMPAEAGPDSVDVLPALLGKSKTARRSLVEHAGTLALVEGDWKYIAPGKGARINQHTNTELGNDAAPQLYDLAKDPEERDNVAAQYPHRVKAMSAELERIQASGRSK